jgi:predicted acetyltransferase
MKLVVPSMKWESAFARFYQDFVQHDIENANYYREGCRHFASYVTTLNEESQGVNLREGYVPCSHFWLVDEQQSILGAIRVRHNIDNDFLSLEAGHIGYDIAPSYRRKGFGKAMLKLALNEAQQLGISKALVTADEDNIASRKVIEANGGRLDNIVQGKVFDGPLARYWIDCNR